MAANHFVLVRNHSKKMVASQTWELELKSRIALNILVIRRTENVLDPVPLLANYSIIMSITINFTADLNFRSRN